MYVRPLKKFLQPSQVETFFKIDGIIKLAKTLKAKMGSWGSTKTEKSPSLHVCHFKIFLKRRIKLGNLRWASGVSFVVTSVHFWKNDPILGSMRR